MPILYVDCGQPNKSEDSMKTQQQLAAFAVDIQDACNITAVSGALNQICKDILHDQHSTDAPARDMSVKLIVAKLADMVGLDYQFPNKEFDLLSDKAVT